MMNNLKTKLNNDKNLLESMIKELNSLPAGALVKRGTLYTHRKNGTEVGITKNTERLQQLCRQKLLFTLEKQLKNNIPVLEQAAKKCNFPSFKEIIASLSKTYQNLPISYFYHPNVAKWLALPHKKNPYPMGDLTYRTNNGVLVRSKSDLFIANLLEEYGIPYLYEVALTLGGQTRYPDFIIMHPITGEIIIWEHFGALHKPEYERKMTEKMTLYLKHGYVPFETLFYTFEFDIGSPERLRNLVKQLMQL